MKSFTGDNWPKWLEIQKYLILKKCWGGGRWGSSFRKKTKKTHNLRLSGIMPRPKSYKSSINLFEKKKKNDSALIDQKQQSIVGKSLHPHCFVTCLRNNVCGRAVWNGGPPSGEENQRQRRAAAATIVLVAPTEWTYVSANSNDKFWRERLSKKKKRFRPPPRPCSQHPSEIKKIKLKQKQNFFLNLANTDDSRGSQWGVQCIKKGFKKIWQGKQKKTFVNTAQ